jgi:hypothetical protein
LGALYALRHVPNFYEIHPWSELLKLLAAIWSFYSFFSDYSLKRLSSRQVLF